MKLEEAIQQQKFENVYQKAMINIIFTANWLHDRQEEIFKAHEILPQHYNILRILRGKHPEAASPGAIKEVMLDKGTDLTRLVDKLVKKDLVKRHVCADNRRKVDIHITKSGLKFLSDMEEPLKKQLSAMRKKLSEKEALLLSDLLDQLRD